MNTKKTRKQKIQDFYLDDTNWVLTPPSIRYMAKKFNVAVGTVHLWVKDLTK